MPRVCSAAGRQPHVAEKWLPLIVGGGVGTAIGDKYLREVHRNKNSLSLVFLGLRSPSVCFLSLVSFCFQFDAILAVSYLSSAMSGLQAIKYVRGKLEVLDQLKLPHEFVYDHVSTCEEAFDCIKAMRVRGNDATLGLV